jgi:hypothetical protein
MNTLYCLSYMFSDQLESILSRKLSIAIYNCSYGGENHMSVENACCSNVPVGAAEMWVDIFIPSTVVTFHSKWWIPSRIQIVPIGGVGMRLDITFPSAVRIFPSTWWILLSSYDRSTFIWKWSRRARALRIEAEIIDDESIDIIQIELID